MPWERIIHFQLANLPDYTTERKLTLCLVGSNVSTFIPNHPLFLPLFVELTAHGFLFSIGELKKSLAYVD